MPEAVLAWPRSVKTDDQGSFTLAGIGRDLTVYLGTRDPRFAKETSIQIQTTDSGKPEEPPIRPPAGDDRRGSRRWPPTLDSPSPTRSSASAPARTGSGAAAVLASWPTTKAGSPPTSRLGQYYSIRAYPPEGQPYLIPDHRFEWNKGAVKTAMDIALPRGVLIRGKVIEEGTGRPLAGASVAVLRQPQK